jgi:uncharacterized membrane protein YfcA
MNPDSSVIPVMAILFAATLVRSAFGFGEALLSVPLLALLMPVEVAAPIAVLVSVVVALVVVVRDWRHVHLGSAGRLVAATLFGTPVGLLLLTRAPEAAVKAGLGAVIVVFSAYSLWTRSAARLRSDRSAWAFGFAAGVLGGAYGMNGPPLAVYGALRGWTPDRFRATLQGYFLPASLAGLVGYWAIGLMTPTVANTFVVSLPAVAAGFLVGRAAARRLPGPAFLRCVHGGLIAVGAVLLWQAAT